MDEANPFQELMQRVRSGDRDAALELVRQYEPAVRRRARIRLRESHLRRVLDSMDVCQSVLGSFFVRVSLGQYQLETADDLLRLLAIMTRNKVVSQARKPQNRPPGDVGSELTAADRRPADRVADADLLHEIRRRLLPDEQRLVELRAAGREWTEIATEVGGTADACRKRHERAVARVVRQLGLEDGDA